MKRKWWIIEAGIYFCVLLLLVTLVNGKTLHPPSGQDSEIQAAAPPVSMLGYLPVSSYEKTILDSPQNKDKNILYVLTSKKHTINDPYIEVNPYGTAPLGGIILFEADEDAEVCITVPGELPISYTIHSKAGLYKLPVIGLYENQTTWVQAEFTFSSGKKEYREYPMMTQAVDLSNTTLLTKDFKINQEKFRENELVVRLVRDEGGKTYAAIYDKNACLRAYYTFSTSMLMPLANGNLLLESPYVGNVNESFRSGLIEITPIGRIAAYYKLPYDLAGGIQELPNGNLLAITSSKYDGNEGDCLMEINRETGNSEKIIDLKEVVAASGSGELIERSKRLSRWIDIYALEYDKSDNLLALFAKSKQIIVMDYDTQEAEILTGWEAANYAASRGISDTWYEKAVPFHYTEIIPDEMPLGETAGSLYYEQLLSYEMQQEGQLSLGQSGKKVTLIVKNNNNSAFGEDAYLSVWGIDKETGQEFYLNREKRIGSLRPGSSRRLTVNLFQSPPDSSIRVIFSVIDSSGVLASELYEVLE